MLTVSVLSQVTVNRWHRFRVAGGGCRELGRECLLLTALVSTTVIWQHGGVNACTCPDTVYI